ncbi:hypothetical protein V499_08978, partial [Pseudogymnoascus sp. VKM F-103]
MVVDDDVVVRSEEKHILPNPPPTTDTRDLSAPALRASALRPDRPSPARRSAHVIARAQPSSQLHHRAQLHLGRIDVVALWEQGQGYRRRGLVVALAWDKEKDNLDWTDYFVGLTGELGGAPYEPRAPTEYTTASPPTPESRTKLLPKRREGRDKRAELMTTMAVENGIPSVAEPEVREEPTKSFKDAVVEGADDTNGRRGEGVNGHGEEEETVLPKSFAEVVVEGAKEGADEGQSTATNGQKKSAGETNRGKKGTATNGDKKGRADERNGDKKGRRERANNDDGGKSYAAA